MCAARETNCTDRGDEDCDGRVDCADADCVSSPSCGPSCAPSPEASDAACRNGTDDDCDGDVDCADADCRAAGVGACFGDWVANDCSTFSRDERGGGWDVDDLQVELTATGFRTVMIIPGISERVEVELVVGDRGTGEFDLQAPANQYVRTCTHCLTITGSGRTYFPRRGTLVLTAVPTRVGERLEGAIGTISDTGRGWVTTPVEFDEVRSVGGELQPIAGARCLHEVGRFSGVAVSGGVVSSGAGSHVAEFVNTRMTAPPTPSCGGDGVCGAGESTSTCPSDCPCSADAFSVVCPDGHLCPQQSLCVSRGRCACGGIMERMGSERFREAIACDTALPCSGSSCAVPAWGCMIVGCGNWRRFNVPCGAGFCISGSTCVGGSSCSCNDGTLSHQCPDDGGALCSDVGGCDAPLYWCVTPR